MGTTDMTAQGQKPRWWVPAAPQTPAGAEIVITPTTAALWRIWSLCFTLTTSAALPVRTVNLTLDDGSTVFWREQADVTFAPSIAANFTCYQDLGGRVGAAGLIHIGMPEGGLYLRQGDKLRTVTTNLDAGDQYSAIGFMIQELPDGPFARLDPSDSLYVEPLAG